VPLPGSNWAEIGANAGAAQATAASRNRLRIECPGALIDAAHKEIWYRDDYRLRADPLPRGATVIGIGANIGMFALYAAASGERASTPTAFADSFALLRRNAERNRMDAIIPCRSPSPAKPVRARCTCRAGTACTRCSAIPAQCTSSASRSPTPSPATASSAATLKLDCEGGEYEILLATPAEIFARIRRVALEYHDWMTAHHHDELRALLERHGFAVTSRDHASSRTGYLFAKRATASP
jgi:hypothetical protein